MHMQTELRTLLTLGKTCAAAATRLPPPNSDAATDVPRTAIITPFVTGVFAEHDSRRRECM